MRYFVLTIIAIAWICSCRLGSPAPEMDFLLINLSMPRSATTSLAGVFANFRSEHEYRISETIIQLLDFRENRITKPTLQAFLRQRIEKSRLQVDSASFFFLAPDEVIETFPRAYFFFTYRPCEPWIVSMVDNSVFAHKMIRERRHTVDISFLDRYSEFFIPGHSHAVFENHELLRLNAEYIVKNLARAWGKSTLGVLSALEGVEPERRLVIHIADFNSSLPRLARLVKIPQDMLVSANLHLNRDRDTVFYTRLLGESRLKRLCTPWQQQIFDWIKSQGNSFPDLKLHETL